MTKDISEIFDICLQMIQEGATSEDCFLQFPDYTDELKSLLQTTLKLKNTPVPHPEPDDLNPLLLKVGRLGSGQRKISPETLKQKLLIFRPRFIKSIAAILILGIFLWPTDAISSRSLPGDILYPIKLITEKVQFFLTFGREDKAELRMVFSQKRLTELTSTLKNDGRFDKELMKKMLQEAGQALDEISGDPPDSTNLLLAKLYHLNTFQKEALENLKMQVSTHEMALIDEGISHCDRNRNRCSRQMGTWQSNSTGRKINPELRNNGQQKWKDNCNW